MTPGRPPESTPAGYPQEIADALEAALPEKLQFIRVAESTVASRIEPVGKSAPDGLRFIARWYGWPEAQHRDVGIAEDATELGRSIASLFADSIALTKGVGPDADGDGSGDGVEPGPEVDYLQSAADDLLFDRSVLEEWIALLEDKKQIIFYGPPGTGKTFVAKRLAKALVDDGSRQVRTYAAPPVQLL